MLVDEVKKELTGHIIPFWKGMRDDTYGGYYGWLDQQLQLDKKAEKGCILNSRILWFFFFFFEVCELCACLAHR